MPTQTAILPVAVKRLGGYAAKQCPERVAKDAMPVTYPPELMLEPDGFLQQLFDSGNKFEDDVFDIVESAGTGVVRLHEQLTDGERTVQGRADLEEDTFRALMDPTVSVILGGRIGPRFESLLSAHRNDGVGEYDPSRISQPDIMVVNRHGSRITVTPVDVKDHKPLTGSAKPRQWSVLSLADLAGDVVTESLVGTPHQVDMMQLAHYQRHLQAMNLAGDNVGAIVGRGPLVVRFDLDHPYFTHPEGRGYGKVSALELYDYKFERAQAITANAAARDRGSAVAPVTFPELSAECDHCPWREVCDQELTGHPDGGHITLLPGITPARAKAHYDAGVSSIRRLARVDPKSAALIDAGTSPDVCDSDTAPYVSVGAHALEQAVYQARVATYQRVARQVGVDRVELHRADVEIDFDLENSNGPVVSRNSDEHSGGPLVYLWGTREVRTRRTAHGEKVSVKVRQFSDFTDTDAGERDAFVRFWDFMVKSRAAALGQGKTWRAFHYTTHELSWMRKLATKHEGHKGVPSVADVDAFLSTGDVVDMYAMLTSQLLWPTRSHSIKDLAKWARFSWRASDAGGDSSLLWYSSAVCDPDPKVRLENAQRLLDYNVDDVAAQQHLRDWVASLESSEHPDVKIPLVTSLRKPVLRK